VCSLCFGALPAKDKADTTNTANLTHLVVIGDSLSAGVQNFSLLDSQQPNGYAALIASQAKVKMVLPLVPKPGIPNVLKLVSIGPPPIIEPTPGTVSALRTNPLQQPTNLAIPGIVVHDALNLLPAPNITPTTNPVQIWATVVLGFPALFTGQPLQTQVQVATSLKPTTLIDWLGNNDALVPALTGQLTQLTPLSQFASDYGKVLDAFNGSGASIITATIPDVTEIPYFTSIRTVAAEAQLNLGTVIKALGVGPKDYVRPGAQPLIHSILSGAQKGPLPANCDPSLPDLSPGPIPCVLTAKDAQTLRETVDAYNGIIYAESFLHGATVVDAHALVDQIANKGYSIGNATLTTSFLGGLFSLDGIHPTNTGYAVIANQFITTMNSSLHTSIPLVNVAAIAKKDPLVFINEDDK
jgi:lysophospholipase L1-like esterase